MEKEYEVTLPKIGESIQHATVVQWFKKEGDHVKVDEPLLEVSTDKVNSEIPSPVAGRLMKIFAAVDQEVEVDERLAILSLDGEGSPEEKSSLVTPQDNQEDQSPQAMKGFFTPVVLKIAQQKGVSLEELTSIPATGIGGRLTKRDLEQYLEKGAPKLQKKTPSFLEDIQRVKMTGMRKAIAHCKRS